MVTCGRLWYEINEFDEFYEVGSLAAGLDSSNSLISCSDICAGAADSTPAAFGISPLDSVSRGSVLPVRVFLQSAIFFVSRLSRSVSSGTCGQSYFYSVVSVYQSTRASSYTNY